MSSSDEVGGGSAAGPPHGAAGAPHRRGVRAVRRRRRGRGVGALGVPRLRTEHPLLLRELRRHRRTARRGLRPGRAGARRGRRGRRRGVGRDSPRGKSRAGMAAVLGFSSADPRRGRVLFTDARANPVLAERRRSPRTCCSTRSSPRSAATSRRRSRLPRVGAAMFTGAMAELAQQWLAGTPRQRPRRGGRPRAGLGPRIAVPRSSPSAPRPPAATPAREIVSHAVHDDEARTADDASEVAAVADSHHRILRAVDDDGRRGDATGERIRLPVPRIASNWRSPPCG